MEKEQREAVVAAVVEKALELPVAVVRGRRKEEPGRRVRRQLMLPQVSLENLFEKA